MMTGDASQIKTAAGMAKSVLGDLLSRDKCNECFSTTQLGSKMQATAVTGSVIVNALTGEDPYRGTGGSGYIPPVIPEEEPEPGKSWNPCEKLCSGLHGKAKWYDLPKQLSAGSCRLACYIGVAGAIILGLSLLLLGKRETSTVIVTGAQTAKEGVTAVRKAV